MAKKHEFIEKNIGTIHKLVRSGDISGKVVAEYKIYQVYAGFKNIKSKMERYTIVAGLVKSSEQIVMKAVKNMESSI